MSAWESDARGKNRRFLNGLRGLVLLLPTLFVPASFAGAQPATVQTKAFLGRAVTPFLTAEKIPSNIPGIPWESPQLKVICLLQLQDGVCRRQAEMLNAASQSMGREVLVVLGSIDEVENKWPVEFLQQFRETRPGWSLPIYRFPAPARASLYATIGPSPIRELPQFFFLDSGNRLLAYRDGPMTAEQIRGLTDSFLAETEAQSPSQIPGLVNGEFNEWGEAEPFPAGWQAWDPDSAAREVAAGNLTVATAEIRSNTPGKRQILFQRLGDATALNGKGIRLSARVRTGGQGRATVALAVPTVEEGDFERTPDSPFVNREGQPIPLRILAKCEFGPSGGNWIQRSSAASVEVPAKVFVMLFYLETNDVLDTSAQIDWVRIADLALIPHQTGPTR